MKKPLLSFFLASVAMIVTTIAVGYLFGFIFPVLETEYENTSLFRPWDDPLMYLYFIEPFIVAGMLIWIWNRVKGLFSGSLGKKALQITLISLGASIIPGMIMTLSSFPVSPLAILTWTITSFTGYWIASVIVIRMNE